MSMASSFVRRAERAGANSDGAPGIALGVNAGFVGAVG
jgi:hypothetical protein